MMAMNKKALDSVPDEIEALLPWHAAGTLSARDSRRVEQALARDPALARQYAAIRDQCTATVALNESLGAPSARARQKLFAAIDAEPARPPSPNVWSRIADFAASLSPRTVAVAAGFGALLLLLQAGVIGAFLASPERGLLLTASVSDSKDTAARPGQAPRVFVRFAPEAGMADITAFLDANQARVIDSTAGGMFRLQIGEKPLSRQESDALVTRLQREKIVNLAAPAQ